METITHLGHFCQLSGAQFKNCWRYLNQTCFTSGSPDVPFAITNTQLSWKQVFRQCL